jgi:tetratricopeptide (TPR) repeat protein
LERTIPEELEIIVLKAMEKRPQDRYPTAQELADDLERFLRIEPIRAKPPTWRQRLVKWGRRHKSLVTFAGIVLFLLLIGSLISIGLITSAYSAEAEQRKKTDEALEKTKDALTAATWQKQRAEANLHRSLRMAEGINKVINPLPVMVRKDLSFLIELSRQAAPVWDTVAADYPDKEEYARQRVITYGILSDALIKSGQFQEAEQAQRKAVDCAEKWALDFSGHYLARHIQRTLRAYHYRMLGGVLRSTGESDDAERAYARALELYEEERQERTKAGHPLDMVWTVPPAIHNSLGWLRLEAGQFSEARQAYAKAQALVQGPIPQLVGPPVQAAILISSHNGLGELLLASGAKKEAMEEFREALRWHQRTPANYSFDGRVAEEVYAWFLVACPIQELRDPQRAIELARQNIASRPRGLWIELSHCWHTLAVAQYRRGDWKAAWDAMQSWPLVQHWDGPVAFVFAMTRWQRGEKKEARDFYDKTVQWMEKNKPRDLELRRFRTEAAQLLGVKEK